MSDDEIDYNRANFVSFCCLLRSKMRICLRVRAVENKGATGWIAVVVGRDRADRYPATDSLQKESPGNAFLAS